MARLMSVALTADAVIERRKTVTRRKGWLMLEPGDRLTLCRKTRGRKPGEPLERLAEVEVVSVRREPLRRLTPLAELSTASRRFYPHDEMILEGCPGMDTAEFVLRYFIDAQGMRASDLVTRIEWRYLDEKAAA